jgi:hypothetical protein
MSVFHQNILAGASGAGSASDPVYSDDVFSCLGYEGTGSAQTITNGVDLSGEGGLVWIKRYDGSQDNVLQNTASGTSKMLRSHGSGQESSGSGRVSSFNSNGFTLGTDADVNANNQDYVSWCFRKCPGFFDVVTYTGNGTAGRIVSHSLGSVPGMIWVKKTSGTGSWMVYHRSTGNSNAMLLQQTNAAFSSPVFNNTTPTSTEFTLNNGGAVNGSGSTYVAYLFAHDDQSFGADQDEAIIKCDVYEGNGSSSGPTINVGFKPQWLMIKNKDSSADWVIVDTQRGMATDYTEYLKPNSSDGQSTFGSGQGIHQTASGFTVMTNDSRVNTSQNNYIYIAIKVPNKPPEAGTDVFKAVSVNKETLFSLGFAPDMSITASRNASSQRHLLTRNTQSYMRTNSSEGWSLTRNQYFRYDLGHSFEVGNFGYDNPTINFFFKEAPTFFDCVYYVGTGSARTQSHSLGAVPELMIFKRNGNVDWRVYAAAMGNAQDARLNSGDAFASSSRFSSTTPTASVFSVSGDGAVNQNNEKHVALLFASVDGVCKIGTYSGSNSAVTVDCGFSAGPRFLLIKATNRNEPWIAYDHVRGIVAGSDPELKLNVASTPNNSDDAIDPTSTGFTVNTGFGSDTNESGNTYFFMAIA